MVEAELALLRVLHDGVGLALRVDLHLGQAVLRDLGDHVVGAAAGLERDVVPGRDALAALLEELAVALGALGLPALLAEYDEAGLSDVPRRALREQCGR